MMIRRRREALDQLLIVVGEKVSPKLVTLVNRRLHEGGRLCLVITNHREGDIVGASNQSQTRVSDVSSQFSSPFGSPDTSNGHGLVNCAVPANSADIDGPRRPRSSSLDSDRPINTCHFPDDSTWVPAKFKYLLEHCRAVRLDNQQNANCFFFQVSFFFTPASWRIVLFFWRTTSLQVPQKIPCTYLVITNTVQTCPRQ